MAGPRPRGPAGFWAKDEEWAKKDDDHRLPGHSRSNSNGQWRHNRTPRRKSLLRLATYAIGLFLIIFIIYNLRSTSEAPSPRLPTFESSTEPTQPQDVPKLHSDESSGHSKGDKETTTTKLYTGPLKLPELANSIRDLGLTGGGSEKNKNVLFAAANLQSAAALLPMACTMSREDTNQVHFALMGSSEITLDELLKVNGIKLHEGCEVRMHGT